MRRTTGNLLVACLSLVLASRALAATITVTNKNDSGSGSLRQTILDALPEDDIQFDPSLDGFPIVLTSGPILITKDLTITGRGSVETIVDGNANSTVFMIQSLVTASISGVTVMNGAHPNAGGIYVFTNAVLHLTDSVVRENVGFDGGGIHNRGETTLTRTIIDDNVAIQGGGVFNEEIMTLTDTTLSRNTGWLYGGGIFVGGPTNITNSTINGNWGGYGGGVWNQGDLDLVNVTIDGNTARLDGGGIGTVRLTVVRNSIVSNQLEGQDCYVIPFPFPWPAGIHSYGHNLDTDGSCELTQPSDLPNTEPMLGPLADNGGSTPTCALLPGSPAIDAGGDDCQPTDQRGVSRPIDGDRDGEPKCDIGAFEYAPPTPNGLLSELIDHVRSLGLHKGTENSLIAKLKTAMLVLTDVVPSNDKACVNVLGAFTHSVAAQRGKKIPEEQADELTAEAQRIIALLDFGGSPAGAS